MLAYTYVDNIALVALNMAAHKELFKILEENNQAIGLKINKGKTKFMSMLAPQYRRWAQNIHILYNTNLKSVLVIWELSWIMNTLSPLKLTRGLWLKIDQILLVSSY